MFHQQPSTYLISSYKNGSDFLRTSASLLPKSKLKGAVIFKTVRDEMLANCLYFPSKLIIINQTIRCMIFAQKT